MPLKALDQLNENANGEEGISILRLFNRARVRMTCIHPTRHNHVLASLSGRVGGWSKAFLPFPFPCPFPCPFPFLRKRKCRALCASTGRLGEKCNEGHTVFTGSHARGASSTPARRLHSCAWDRFLLFAVANSQLAVLAALQQCLLRTSDFDKQSAICICIFQSTMRLLFCHADSRKARLTFQGPLIVSHIPQERRDSWKNIPFSIILYKGARQ